MSAFCSRPGWFIITGTLFLVLLASGGCALFGGSGGGDGPEGAEGGALVELQLALDKPSYRLGEMVVCTVQLRNLSDEAVSLTYPFVYEKRTAPGEQAEPNLFFLVARQGAVDIWRKRPVHPDPEAAQYAELERSTVAPGQTLERRFGFVNLTEFPGEFRLTAQYTANLLPAGSSRNLAVAPYVRFAVDAPRVWERDREGLILKSEAIGVARRELGGAVERADAILIATDTGLFDWWVTLRRPVDAGPGPRAVACYVNPYTGKFRREAKPFELREEQAGGAQPMEYTAP